MINFNHKPVLLKESVDLLNISSGKKYIDATIGGGGHAEEILKRGGIVLGIDQDEEAINYLREKLKISKQTSKINEDKLVLVEGNFSDIKEIAHSKGFNKVGGIIFDLGLSSYQIDRSGRGFSFLRKEPLDMRMSKKTNLTAYEIINTWSKEELYDLFSKMGEERFSLPISNSIARSRRIEPLKTTFDLVKVVEDVVPENSLNEILARIFQSIRIGINLEMDNLEKGLVEAFDLLEEKGRLAVISFHSLEDRQVKMFFKEKCREKRAVLVNKKVIISGSLELKENRRARSAKLRVLEKIIV